MILPGLEMGSARFSDCGTYRYSLFRTWGNPDRACLFVMLNPSTADAEVNDPTIRRCIGFAQSWGYGGLEVVNLFAYRSTNPTILAHVNDPIGPGNDDAIFEAVMRAQRVILAWGNEGGLMNRGNEIREKVCGWHAGVYTFGFNQTGEPKHPLYLPERNQLCCLSEGG